MRSFDHRRGEVITKGDAEIYYECHGKESDLPLVFLHGGFSNMEEYNGVLRQLPEKFRVIGIDSRGHGKSTLGSEKLTYDLLQKDIEKILAHLNITQCSIVGFSDGGILAYRLAALTNLNIEKIITIGASWHYKNIAPVTELFKKITAQFWQEKHPEDYEAYQRLNPQPDFDYFTTQVIQMWLDPTSTGHPNENVKNIKCPVLAIRGELDPFVALADLEELKMQIKDCKLLNIAGTGHAVFKENVELFLLNLVSFLQPERMESKPR